MTRSGMKVSNVILNFRRGYFQIENLELIGMQESQNSSYVGPAVFSLLLRAQANCSGTAA